MKKSERTDNLAKYIKDIQRYPVFTRKEERVVADKAFKGDKRAKQQLVEHNLRFVVMLANKVRGYTSSGKIDLLDLINEGNIGLMKAVEKFEPSRGLRLNTYATWWIRSYMQRCFVPNYSIVKMGSTIAQRTLFAQMGTVRTIVYSRDSDERDKLRQELLLKYSSLTPKDLMKMEERVYWTDVSIDTPMSNTGDFTLQDIMTYPGTERQENDQIELEFKRHHFHQAFEYLNGQEKEVIKRRWLDDDKETLKNIADTWGLSRERVRQIEAQAIKRIRQNLGKEAKAIGKQLLGSHGVFQEYINSNLGNQNESSHACRKFGK